MGGIMSGIKRLPQTVIVDRYFDSTRLCPHCGNNNKIPLEAHRYECACGYAEDRDTHAARNILAEGLRILESTRGARGLKMLAEDGTAVKTRHAGSRQVPPVKQEAQAFRLG
jgi:transposase